MRKIAVEKEGGGLNFEEALEAASLEAALSKGIPSRDLVVVAWYDNESRRSYPEVGTKEGQVVNWEHCARNQGADTWIELDGGRYIFLCRSSLRH